jgi:hypothetical protein
VSARLLAVAVVAWASTAAAAPAADVVVFDAAAPVSPALRDALAATAARRGAAWIDVTPAPVVAPATGQAIAAAQRDYDQLQFDAAVGALDRAAAEVERTGAAGLDPIALSDLFLFRGLARVQLGDARAWDDLVEAAALAPARALDPARLPPRALEAYGRAAEAARTAPRALVIVRTPDRGCDVAIDGAPATEQRAQVAAGRHFVAVRCAGRRPWGGAVTTAAADVTLDAAPAAEASPTDDELLIQARTAGAAAVVAIEVRGAPAIVAMRRLGVDGKLQDRASIAATGPRADADATAALDRLLAPAIAVVPERWYDRHWVWAAAGAGLVTAILVPVLIFDDRLSTPATPTLDPKGLPW